MGTTRGNGPASGRDLRSPEPVTRWFRVFAATVDFGLAAVAAAVAALTSDAPPGYRAMAGVCAIGLALTGWRRLGTTRHK